MADKDPNASEAPFAKRIDPEKEGLTKEQLQFIKQVELQHWGKKAQKVKTRNLLTAFAFGAVVVGIYGYTFWSVSQENIMDELDEEAKRARTQTPKTGAN